VDTCGRAAGLGSPNIDGLFLDDGWGSSGPSEVESHSVADMGLSPSQLRDIRGNWSETCRGVSAKLAQMRGAASVAHCNPVVFDWDFPMRRLFLLRNIEGATDAGRLVVADEPEPLPWSIRQRERWRHEPRCMQGFPTQGVCAALRHGDGCQHFHVHSQSTAPGSEMAHSLSAEARQAGRSYVLALPRQVRVYRIRVSVLLLRKLVFPACFADTMR
jgi:hypothetical protein